MQFRLHLLSSIELPFAATFPLDECEWRGYVPAACIIKSTVSIGTSGLIILDGEADFLNTEDDGTQLIGGHAVGLVDDTGKELICACRRANPLIAAPKGAFKVLLSIYAQSYIGVP